MVTTSSENGLNQATRSFRATYLDGVGVALLHVANALAELFPSLEETLDGRVVVQDL